MTGGSQYELTLRAGGRSIRGQIAQVGAAIRHLSIDGVDLTAGVDDRQPVPHSCGTVLVPWPNRVRGGRWAHRGCTQQLDLTDPGTGSALHGLLRDTAYVPTVRSDSSIRLSALVRAQRGYPFPLDTSVRYRLVADGLIATHTVRNVGTACAPVALGAHPFLAIGDVPTEALTLSVNGCRHIDVDDRLIPVGVTAVDGTDWDLRGGRTVADLDLDDAWAVDNDEGATLASLRAPDGRTVSLWGDRHFGYVHVFTTRAFPRGDGSVTAVALEPMTAPADAFNHGVGLRWLKPGDALSATWAIRYAMI
ncbi:aldose 1-epimerase family protein [Mycolicibacterium confluentis]|uniref:Aldose 1-epimerase n=1 Tax=Mycolicibacterium confluentis TaxID=28047 RepID=A0A7I7Y0G6_9MYCO|nr:aldose 1-epimerase family protein [Mycolicibacterium confluentis]MCV7320042.1 aldose 1-epimerase family protein [Mycolicibacterium confluentis]ORV34590.1 aldose epimerase [Mycolicibacterium confluentis]BBZ35077.1 aldose 1-epimerase [Mycolicibacterium confluentis]